MSAPTIGELLFTTAETLNKRGLPSPRLDAEVLLAYLLQKSRTDLYINIDQTVPENRVIEYLQMVQKRLAREPISYITGEQEFMSLAFRVNRDVLIPRPETEIIVEEVTVCKPRSILDIGTGSGAIAVSSAYYLPESRVWAVDISVKALEVARFNACRHGVADRISFFAGNLLEPLRSEEYDGFFDVITANLPYIPTGEMDSLPRDVLGYEPQQALDRGTDGLMYYRELAPGACRLLREGGVMLLEIGWNQAVQLKSFINGLGFTGLEVKKDLAGLDRIVKVVNGKFRR